MFGWPMPHPHRQCETGTRQHGNGGVESQLYDHCGAVDGVVTKKAVEVGQIVQQGQGLMMTVPLNDVWVTANFKETQLRDVRPGQRPR